MGIRFQVLRLLDLPREKDFGRIVDRNPFPLHRREELRVRLVLQPEVVPLAPDEPLGVDHRLRRHRHHDERDGPRLELIAGVEDRLDRVRLDLV